MNDSTKPACAWAQPIVENIGVKYFSRNEGGTQDLYRIDDMILHVCIGCGFMILYPIGTRPTAGKYFRGYFKDPGSLKNFITKNLPLDENGKIKIEAPASEKQ